MKDKNSGYIGRKMSKNAAEAHKNGQFPISSISSKLLKENGFEYSVDFFKWLCEQGYVVPLGWHHTGVACNMTAFYNRSTITYVADKYNLELLYQMYSGEINREDAKQILGITYVRAKVVPSALGFKMSALINADMVKCGDYYYFSKDKKVVLGERQIEIMQEWDKVPQGWKNKETDAIVRMLICKKQ